MDQLVDAAFDKGAIETKNEENLKIFWKDFFNWRKIDFGALFSIAEKGYFDFFSPFRLRIFIPLAVVF
jgi:hypothetical protein